MDSCSPVPEPDGTSFTCAAPGRDYWGMTVSVEGMDLRTAVAAFGAVLHDHDLAHPQPKVRTRSAKPKFRAGLGMAPGTKITQVGASTTGTG